MDTNLLQRYSFENSDEPREEDYEDEHVDIDDGESDPANNEEAIFNKLRIESELAQAKEDDQSFSNVQPFMATLTSGAIKHHEREESEVE